MCKLTSATAAADLRSRLCGFVTDEAGAVTVDWVVLTGAAVGLCMGMFASVNTGIYSVGEGLGQRMSEATVKDLGTVNDW